MLKTHIQPILAFFFNSNTDSNLYKFDTKPNQSQVAPEGCSTEQNQWRDYWVNQTFVDGFNRDSSKQNSSKQTSKPSGLITVLQQVWNAVLTPDTEPRIRQHVDRFGQPYWRAYDPTTTQERTFFSEEEVYQWLERRYYE